MNICSYTPTKYLDDRGYNERFKLLFKNVCYLLGKSSGTINLFDATITFAVNADPNTPGTTFDPNTPSLENVVYVSTIDDSLWTYNGAAYVSYVPPYWSKLGNADTDPLINFIGTTDAQDLVFKTNGVENARITSVGNFGIGLSPNYKFDVETNDAGLAVAAFRNTSSIGAGLSVSVNHSNGNYTVLQALGGMTGSTSIFDIRANGNIIMNSIPEYANRTAAVGGGLTAGMLYSLPISGDNKVICIV